MFSQWGKLPSLLSKPEKILLVVFVFALSGSSLFLINSMYANRTELIPSRGGEITEGVIGSPRFINPLYSEPNDADRDLVELIFSGLLKYDAQGKLIPDLATNIEVESEGAVFVVDLREDVRWHNGEPFTADDVVYTIKTIQDPKFKSPIRANWIGVEIERISDFRVRFRIQESFAPFPERLTQKIIPSHIWRDISPENFTLSPANLQPIGTGPYFFVNLSQNRNGSIREVNLRLHEQYHGDVPFIEFIRFSFFKDEEDLAREAARGNVDTFSLASPENIANISESRFTANAFTFPRYFAVFFNLDAPKSQDIIEEKNIRKALFHITDAQALTDSILGSYGKTVSSPLLPNVFGLDPPTNIIERDLETALALLESEGFVREDGRIVQIPRNITGEFQSRLEQGDQGAEVQNLQECLARDPEVYPEGQITGGFGPLTKAAVIRFQEKYAAEILTPGGYTEGTGTVGPSTRAKLNEICFQQSEERIPLTLTISTVDQFPLQETAELLKKQWEDFGITVKTKIYSPLELERDVLKPRAYQALLFGEILGKIPDPFPFWHSSQKEDPGLNLSSLQSDTIDKLLERGRKEIDEEARNQIYAQLQDELIDIIPALFLYDMDYTYFTAQHVNNVTPQIISDPSKRFSGISQWYVKTKRAWK